jgi:quinol monooxygenase YgiN
LPSWLTTLIFPATTLTPFSREARVALLAAHNHPADPESRTRYQMILLRVERDLSPRQIAPLVHRSHATVLRVLPWDRAGGVATVPRAHHLASDVPSWHLGSGREVAMIVVMWRLRLTSPQAAQEVCRVVHQAIERSQEPGWLRGRCVASASDPEQVVIIEEWGSRAAFDAWFNSPALAKYDQQSAPLRVGPVQREVYEEV